MSIKEPYIALSLFAAMWGLYGGFYFLKSSSKSAKPTLLTERPASAAVAS